MTGNIAKRNAGGIAVVEFPLEDAPERQVTLALANSIVSGNTSEADLNPDFEQIIEGPFELVTNYTFTEMGTNLLGTELPPANFPSAIFTDDPMLSSLSFNGGRTRTMLPTTGSLARNAGTNTFAVDQGRDGLIGTADDRPLLFDQRGDGFDRIQDDVVDLGAAEG